MNCFGLVLRRVQHRCNIGCCVHGGGKEDDDDENQCNASIMRRVLIVLLVLIKIRYSCFNNVDLLCSMLADC